jgi:hypothetical protein
MIRVEDQTELLLTEVITPERQVRAIHAVCSDLGQIVRQVLSDRRMGQNASGREACPAIAEAMRFVEARIASWVQGKGSFEWLYIIRRLPASLFDGRLSTTGPYDRALAEVLSARSRVQRVPSIGEGGGAVVFDVRRSCAEQITRLWAGVMYLADLHVAYRWAAKGATTTLRRDGRLDSAASASVVRAARLYDARAAWDRPTRGGTILFDDERVGDESLLMVHYRAPRWMEVPWPDDTRVEVRSPFAPSSESVSRLLTLTAAMPDQFWAQDAYLLLMLARISLVYVHRHRAGYASAVQRGYLIARPEFFEEIANEALAANDRFLLSFPAESIPKTGADLLRAAEAMTGTSWPLIPGPVMRRAGPAVCLDLVAMSQRLEAVLEYPAELDSERAAPRARHFEDVVQEVIDRSTWQPSRALAAIRRRTLTRGGQPITDIDAIGERDGVLLLVSCKSKVYTREHDRGDHRAIRNTASDVERDVGDWKRKVARLRASRGDNFDLAAYTSDIAFVCVPHVPYAPEGEATVEVTSGLRACASFGEFVRWLGA